MRAIPLTEEDVKGLKAKGRPRGALGKIREMHHLVAQLYAQGLKPTQIAAIVKRTPQTVRNWLNTPANIELVARLEKEYCGEAFTVVKDSLDFRRYLSEELATVCLEQLVSAAHAGELTNSEALRILDSRDDRTGMGKMVTNVNLHGDLGDRLDAAVERSRKVIEGRVEGNVIKLNRRF